MMEKDPKEKKYTSILKYILEEDLEGDIENAEEILKKRSKELIKDVVRQDLELVYKRVMRGMEIEVISKIEVYPVLAKSGIGDPDDGVFLVGHIGDRNDIHLQVIDFNYVGYEEFFDSVEDDPFYHPTY